MRKLLLCIAACLLLAACGAPTSGQAIPTPTPTPTPSLQGIWTTTTDNNRQTVVLSIQAVGDQYVAASSVVALDCHSYPGFQQYQSKADVEIYGSDIHLYFWIFYFDSEGYMHSATYFSFVGQLTSPSTLEITTSDSGTIQTIVLHATTVPEATIITNAVNSYSKVKSC